MPLTHVVQWSWFLSPFYSQGAWRPERGGTCLRSHSQCLAEVGLKAALGAFLTLHRQVGSQPLPPSSAVIGLAKILEELMRSWRGGQGSQICHLSGAGLERSTDINWGAGSRMSSLFPIAAAWPDRGLCLGWRGDSILSCSSCFIQPGSSSQLLVLP